MSSKQIRQRWSWALDQLAEEMTAHFGLPDKTAFVKGLVRYLATVDKSTSLHFSIRCAQETPAVQDKIDEELLRMWRAGEHLHGAMLERTIKEIAERENLSAEKIKDGVTEEFIARVKAKK